MDLVAGWLAAASAARGARPRHPIVVNSLPKAGTNLLLKALAAMPGTHPMRTGLFGATAPPKRPGRATVPVGVDWPVSADALATRRLIGRTPPGGLLPAHLPYSETLATICAEAGARMVVIVRDPRDVAVSLAAYVVDRPHHFLHARFLALDRDERIVAAMEGLPADESGRGLRGLAERTRDAQAWSSAAFCLLVRFEDLVGPEGGGNRDRQVRTLEDVAEHVGVAMDADDMLGLARSLFGGTDTFRRGRVGGWQELFTDEQRKTADRLLGSVLDDLGYGPSTGP